MTTIQAIRFHETGGPDVLRLEPVELPDPPPGAVRVRHTAVGVNYIDTYHRGGLYPVPLPSGLGSEAVGRVEALGEGVTRFAVGDRVGTPVGPLGAYAQASNIPADKLLRLPDGVTDEVAAASLLKGMTAEFLLRRCHAVQPGDVIVVHAAAGGVGQIACQWAKHLGALVIGTTTSPSKVELAKRNGCAHVLDSHDPDWAKRVREITGGKGVPVVYDSIGKDTFLAGLECLAPRGVMVTYGNASGPVEPFSPALLAQKGSLYVTRPTLFAYVRTPEELQASADALFEVIASGAVTVRIDQTYPLAEAARAHADLQGKKTTGATILVP